jgi:hypothetical protein
LQNTGARYGWDGAIVREKSCTAGCQCGHKLKSIRRLDSRRSSWLCRGTQMNARNLRNTDPATLREKSLIAFG